MKTTDARAAQRATRIEGAEQRLAQALKAGAITAEYALFLRRVIRYVPPGLRARYEEDGTCDSPPEGGT